jgi:hypothetical protein
VIRRGRRDDDGEAHRVVLFERAHDLGNRRLLLADRAVNADDVLAALVDDRVRRDRGLPGLPVADDQLALPAADRHHAVDRLQARLNRLLHRLPVDDARRQAFNRQELLRLDRSLAVDRLAQRVDDAPEHLVADRDRDDPARALDDVAFLDRLVIAQQHRADAFLLEVERDPEDAVRELEHLAGHGPFDAVHARDPVADGDDAADFGHVDLDGVAADLVANNLGDLFGFDIHQRCSSSRTLIFASCVAMLPS